MKKNILLMAVLFALAACDQSVKNPKEPIDPEAEAKKNAAILNDTTKWTTIQWLDDTQDFGKVTDGETVQISFHFKNTGKHPLVFTSVQASCGCTVPSRPDAPVPPGGEGVIKAEFNSSGRVGVANKTVTVMCNTAEQTYTLSFNGEVLPKKQ